MGEEDKKPDEMKPEEANKAGFDQEKKGEGNEAEKPPEKKQVEESKDGMEAIKEAEQQPLPPPPPQEIVLRVFMHCEGCARKVRRCLKGFEGVESIETDCRTHKVVVKGEKADPLKVLDRVQRKSHRQVELISPIPVPRPPKPEPIEKPTTQEKKQEIITVVLKVYMHCEACAQEIKRRIQRMKGVESVDPDLKSSQVTVKGAIDPATLVEYVHRRTGKHAAIVNKEPEKKPENLEEEKKGEAVETEKKGEGGESEKKAEEEESRVEEKGGGGGGGGEGKGEAEAEQAAEEAPKVVEVKKNEHQYYPQRYIMEMYPFPPQIVGEAYPAPQMVVDAYPAPVVFDAYPPQMVGQGYPPQMVGHAYPPQMFSDENPNACSVM